MLNLVGASAVETGAAIPLIAGIDDDPTPGTGAPPTTPEDIYALRCSSVLSVSPGLSTLYFKPIDVNRWLYCNSGVTGSDPRLVIPAQLYLLGNASGTVTLSLFYTIEFEGATEPS